MSLASRILGRLWKLPAAIHHDIATEPLRIPMRDGVELLADRYYSRQNGASAHRAHPKLLWTPHVQTLREPSSPSAACRW